ncbi:MAG TPA: hypothetical protein VFD83_03050, partial [Candidatus Polarisedimenticolia bacterium]|nr:hypothetical protein [Candidatus Polarisedimenticolia bacterium]
MSPRRVVLLVVAMFALALTLRAGARPAPTDRFRKPAPVRVEPRVSGQERRIQDARAAYDRNQIAVARELLQGIDPAQLPRDLGEEAFYLSATLAEDAATSDRLLDEYLKNYPRGAYRRAASLALARSQFAQGDYREAETLLSIFSPGVERDPLGREGLVWMGLAQLGRGDASGALTFLLTAKGDLDGSNFEEAYYFATAEAALRAG